MTHIVAVSAGEVVEVRAVARRPLMERWSREELEALRATPWAWKCPEGAVAGEAHVIPHMPAAGAIPAEPVQRGPAAPMRVNITAHMLEQHGYTVGCRGCMSRVGKWRNTVNHTEDCRKRVEEEIRK